MPRVAVVTKNQADGLLNRWLDFNMDYFYLTESTEKKILKADISLDMSLLDDYEFVILVGADCAKHVGKISSVLKHQGTLVDNKWLPLTNPNMLKFKPEEATPFNNALESISDYINGNVKDVSDKYGTFLLNSEESITNYLKSLVVKDYICLDTETTSLYPRDGYVLGISISTNPTEGYYLNADYITDEHVALLQNIINKNTVVFHNAKFDIKMLEYHFNFKFREQYTEDTMLLHYCLNEQQGTHGLKELAIKYTDLGDYDKDLETYKKDYCKKKKMKLQDFTYDLIPVEIITPYACKDTIVTYQLYKLFKPRVKNSKNLSKVYDTLLMPGTFALKEIEDNGVPFSIEQLYIEKTILDDRLSELEKEMYEYDAIKQFESRTGKLFNTGSPQQKRELLFDILKLKGPGKKTSTGALSTDAEVLEELAEKHPLPKLMLEISKLTKIKTTYIDKIILSLDSDSRLRTFFNLHTTTSGRLSSSGKLNMQTMPRSNKAPKRCIKARDGWKIISGDLGTAEMYIAAVLSNDPILQSIFIKKEDYHSMIAKYKFNLPYSDKEIKEFYNDLRQEAKTTSFEILYKLNFKEPILERFTVLKDWLKEQKQFIEENGFIYQFFGRKRRVPNVFSTSSEVKAHEVRSAVNAVVQGPSSDINLLAAIDMLKYIKKHNMKAKIFALVHDSILAEVPDNEVEEYSKMLKYYMQYDRGLSIPDCPIKVDIEIGQSYAFE